MWWDNRLKNSVFFCSDEHSGKVKSFMLDVLSPLITESDNVSSQLLDIILINIVEPQKSSKKNAYYLAKELIIKTNETMEQYIQQVSNWKNDKIAKHQMDYFLSSYHFSSSIKHWSWKKSTKLIKYHREFTI